MNIIQYIAIYGILFAIWLSAFAIDRRLRMLCDLADHMNDLLLEHGKADENHYRELYALGCEATEYAERGLQAEISTLGKVGELVDTLRHPPDVKDTEDEKTAEEKLKEKHFTDGVLNILGYNMETARKKDDK